MLSTRAKSLLSFLNDFNRCFSLRYSSVLPSCCLCFPALPLSSSRSLNLFRPSIPFVRSLFSLPSIISTGEFSFVRHSSSLFLLRWIQFKFFVVDRILSLSSNISLCSFASRQFIIPEFGRHLRRFIRVRINSRLSPHSNLSIVPVHHFSFDNPFQRCFFSVDPNPQVFSQDLT